MKKKVTLFLAALLVCNTLALPAMAEEGQPTESTPPATVTEPTQPSVPAPTESVSATEPTQATDPAPDPSTAPTESTEPKPCTHVYGEWTADEAAHGRKCTLCGYAEANGHTWAAETVTVDPTCGEAGGECKICTVCQGVLVTKLIEPTGEHTFDNACDTKCNGCGAERTVEHTFGTGWKYSGKGHWHSCTICGAAGEVKDHYPGPAATEEKEQICLTCGMIMMKKKAHTHKWDTQWSSDAENHWYVCSSCTETKENSVHSYDNNCDTSCNVCGYTREADHQYGIWQGDDNGHWQECAFCGDKTLPEVHEPNQNGMSETQCMICQHPMMVEHIHEFSEQWKQDDTSHWQECNCGERTNAEDHSWDPGTEEKKVITYTCEICQAQKQEQAPEKQIPWLLVAAGGAILLCLAGIVVCLLVMRKNREDDR